MALKLSGVVLSCEEEVRDYTSKKTGRQEKLVIRTVALQGDYGLLVGTAFNPKTDLTTIKQGQKITVEISEYKVDSGIQRAILRM